MVGRVQQTSKVVDLLEYFARVQRPVGLSEMSREMGWPRSSTYSLMQLLAERGYLYEPVARAGYYPSPRWQTLLQTVAEAEPLPEVLFTLVRELSQQTGETVVVSAPAGKVAVCLARHESAKAIRYFAQVGQGVPIHASASGRALLQQYSRSERMKLYRSIHFQQYNVNTPMSIEAIEAELRKASERGWQQSLSEYTPDLIGIGIPLPLGDRRLSLVVTGPSFRMREQLSEVADRMYEAVNYHADELGLPPLLRNAPAKRKKR